MTDRFRLAQSEVVKWAHNRGIFSKGTPYAQFKKTMEEVMELGIAIHNEDTDGIADAIGDAIVTLIIQAEMQNIDPIEALEDVLEIIKARQGKMVDGIFVKET